MLSVHRKKGHRTKFLCPITKLNHHLSAILYIDDTNLLHIDPTKDETVNEVHTTIQESVNSWGNILIATGCVLQPSKCFYSIILFKWANGEWGYKTSYLNKDFGITVPLPGYGQASICHKLVNHAEKTLGTMTAPDRNRRASIDMMQEKAQMWVNDVRNGHPQRQNV
jgi:hypothetical protein